MNNCKYIFKRNQYYQNNLLNLTDTFVLTKLQKEYVLKNLNLNSDTDSSQFNFIKAQKYILLKSFFNNKLKFYKTIDKLNIKNSIYNPNEILFFISILLQMNANSKIIFYDNFVEIFFNDLLLNFRKLDFFKINLKSLTDISVKLFFVDKSANKTNKWIINEIFSK